MSENIERLRALATKSGLADEDRAIVTDTLAECSHWQEEARIAKAEAAAQPAQVALKDAHTGNLMGIIGSLQKEVEKLEKEVARLTPTVVRRR